METAVSDLDRTRVFMCADRVADFTDDEEEFSSNDEGEAEGSDSEPMPEDAMGRRSRKSSRAKIPANARVSDRNNNNNNIYIRAVVLKLWSIDHWWSVARS